MKVKEIERTANIAWSPVNQYPVYVVAGTAAQQLDATFSTSAALEVYSLSLSEPGLEMPKVGTVPSEHRYYKALWGSQGMSDSKYPAGLIMAGSENGSILGYNASELISGGGDDALVFKDDRHGGAVKALDFNLFQANLLASGASDSEIFIWDLNKPDSPMTPGIKSQPPEEVSCIAWNRQVQHILASTFAARCVVWDLRKNEPIIRVSDSMSGMKSRLVAWHPEIATQLCLASEDDHTPIIQLWDLRYATSPLRVLEKHKRGILSLTWCPQDPDLLLSCGKDNRILCWNPNSNVQGGEIICELPTSNQWSFDVQWCPRNPGIISSASFDGHVTIFSLMGGGHPMKPTNKIAESFSTTDPFNQSTAVVEQDKSIIPLLKPPKWLRKPVGASFAFGGKLVSFEHLKSSSSQHALPRQVYISQVVTETELLLHSSYLEQALKSQQFSEFCNLKIEHSQDTMQENIWHFLKINFEKEPRSKFLQLLGYDQTDLARKVAQHTGAELDSCQGQGIDALELAQKMSVLKAEGTLKPGLLTGSEQASPSVGSKTPVESGEDPSEASSLFDDIASQQTINSRPHSPLTIPTNSDSDGLLGQALLTGNFEAAVEMCVHENKMAEAILLAIAGGPELLTRTQKKYFVTNKSCLGRLISSIVTRDWTHIIETCDLDNWKEALAIIITYATPEEFSSLCDSLGTRLEVEKDGEFAMYASLCYICSGNVEKLVENLQRSTNNNSSPLSLQDLVEKVMVLRKAVEISQGQVKQISKGPLADKLNRYSSLLAAQGSLDVAMDYLGNSSEFSLAILRDRMYHALGQGVVGTQIPPFPFEKVTILSHGQTKQQQQQQQPHIRSQQSTYQAQAQSNLQTTTTPSYSQAQYTGMNGPAFQPLYSPASISSLVTASTGAPVSKGTLSHKYPAYPDSVANYGLDTYSQQNLVPSNLSNQQNYYNAQVFPVPPSNMYNPVSTPGGPQAQQPLPSYQEVRPMSAWNDPPLLKEKTPKPYNSSGAITSPVYGLPQQQQLPQNSEQSPPGAPVNNYPNLYNPQEHQQTAPAPKPQKQMEPPKEVVKGPLPGEHKVLQDIFDALLSNCLKATTSAQTKRKLDDVVRKLEYLYDRLRENSLSNNITLGLHQIAKAVQQYDYNTGLQIYTQIVSQGNFSEIGSFMPGLKMLIQTAAQLQVYVQ